MKEKLTYTCWGQQCPFLTFDLFGVVPFALTVTFYGRFYQHSI